MKTSLFLRFAGVVLLTVLVVLTPRVDATTTQMPGSMRVQRANLRDTLVNGLRVSAPEDKAFIDVIVKDVEKGRLPEKLVYAAFRWARKKYPEHPFPYFVQALLALIKRAGIKL